MLVFFEYLRNFYFIFNTIETLQEFKTLICYAVIATIDEIVL